VTDPGGVAPRNLTTLQAGRAIAIVLVVLYHNSVAIFAQYWGIKPLGRLFDFGDSGFYFFFVLSGFIIPYVHHQDLGQPGRVKSFAWKRFCRVYPLYWIVLVVVLPVFFRAGGVGGGGGIQPGVILDSIVLLHFVSLQAVIAVSWPLFHGVLFYLLFCVAIWRVRPGFIVMGVWLALSAVCLATDQSSMLTGFYFSPMNLLFGFGMAGAWLTRRGAVPMPAILVLVGVTVFLLAGADQAYWKAIAEDWRTLIYGLGAMLAIIGVVQLENAGRLTAPAWLRLLGDASYSIFLVHFFVLWFLAKLAWASGAARVVPALVAYLALPCLAIAAGAIFYRAIEVPLVARLGRRISLART